MKGLLKRLFFPPRCASCRELVDWYGQGVGLCDACMREWEIEKREACAICGEAVCKCNCMPEEMQKAKCKGFRKLAYYYPNTHKKVQNRLIYTIKENAVRNSFEFLAGELLGAVKEIVGEDPTENFLIAYLPRTREAKRRYDVDQAEQLARALSAVSGIEIVRAFERNGGVQQKELTPAQRTKNARESYRIRSDVSLKGKQILLVDDIVTTGAGMAVGAKLCRRAGAAGVYCLAAASDIVNREIQ
ncbi:MAG: ComF family protein [Clostridia bacterium]|nr:ComF family protein [Clostridia bacterium]